MMKGTAAARARDKEQTQRLLAAQILHFGRAYVEKQYAKAISKGKITLPEGK